MSADPKPPVAHTAEGEVPNVESNEEFDVEEMATALFGPEPPTDTPPLTEEERRQKAREKKKRQK